MSQRHATIQTVPGEFHWRDGLTFTRLPDGSVRLRQWTWHEDFGDRYALAADLAVIPAAEWESIVVAVR